MLLSRETPDLFTPNPLRKAVRADLSLCHVESSFARNQLSRRCRASRGSPRTASRTYSAASRCRSCSTGDARPRGTRRAIATNVRRRDDMRSRRTAEGAHRCRQLLQALDFGCFVAATAAHHGRARLYALASLQNAKCGENRHTPSTDCDSLPLSVPVPQKQHALPLGGARTRCTSLSTCPGFIRGQICILVTLDTHTVRSHDLPCAPGSARN